MESFTELRDPAGFRVHSTIMENQMEKKMENEMETGFIWGIIGIRVSQN